MNEILDQPEKRKRFTGKWMGAAYFGFSIALLVLFAIIAIAVQTLIGDSLESFEKYNYFNKIMAIGVVVLIGCNLVGCIVSIHYLAEQSNGHQKVASFIGLLLNLMPLGVLAYFVGKL